MINFIQKASYSESVLWNNSKFCGKILTFSKFRSTSLHYHAHKEEHFWVSEGAFLIQLFMGSEHDYRASVRAANPMFNMIDLPTYSGRSMEKMFEIKLNRYDDLHISPGQTHRIIALESPSILAEFSTYDLPTDSYRIDVKREWREEELL